MDPFDPLTEIINSGQAFSFLIALERILWLMIGFFFIGAISTSIKNGMKDQGWFGNKSFMMNFNKKLREDDKKKIEEKGNIEEKK